LLLLVVGDQVQAAQTVQQVEVVEQEVLEKVNQV
jgi:hypothetical protein